MSNQKPRTIEEQIRLLRSRGMQFSSEEYAKECLSHISYFRLKYYWTDMIDEETEHNFLKGASFDDVIARYNFDRSLRLILFDAIEIIEVALRAKIINHLSQAKDSGLWYLDKSLFEKMEYYEDFLLDLKYEFERSTEPFAKEYIAKHTNYSCYICTRNIKSSRLRVDSPTELKLSHGGQYDVDSINIKNKSYATTHLLHSLCIAIC